MKPSCLQAARQPKTSLIADGVTTTNFMSSINQPPRRPKFPESKLSSQAAKPSMSAMIFFERFKKLRLAKIRPQRRRDDQLRVRNLPQQKIADAHFAARADQQIGIGPVSRVQMLRENFFGDVLGIKFAGLRFFRDAARGVHDFRTA